MKVETNQQRAAEVIADEFGCSPHALAAQGMAHAIAEAGLLMPNFPEPKWPGFWEVDGLEINSGDKDGEVDLDWREGDYYRGEDRSLWLNREQVIAILAAANHAEQGTDSD